MVNLTVNDRETASRSCNALGLLDENQRIILSAFNILLSIIAFLGNVLIIIALQKPSSLHPSSKLLFGCLAVTDLGVGLIAQPLRVTYLMSPEHSTFCYYVWVLFSTLGLIFCGVSLLTVTVISIDRLLALMLGLRYKHVVTLRRVWVVVTSLWLSIITIVIIIFYNFSTSYFVVCTIVLLCTIISTCSYTKIYFTLRKCQAQLQGHTHQARPNGGCSEQFKRPNPQKIARYRKSVASALWIQMTLVACYLPFGVVTAILSTTGRAVPSIKLAWETTIIIFLLNSSLNPIIYCWKIKEIRQAGKDTICRFCCCLR